MPGTESLTPRILVIRFSSLGDVVLAAPVFRFLKRSYPESSVTCLTGSIFADIHRSNPDVDHIWGFDPETQSLSALIRKVREAEFDRIVDLHGSLRSRLVTLVAGTASSRFRQQRLRRLLLVMRPPLKRSRPLTPVIDRYLKTAGCHDPVAGESTPAVYLTVEQLDRGMSLRQELLTGSDGRLIILLPGARHAPKEWPRFRFIELGDLLRRGGDRPVVVAPPDQPEIGAELHDGDELPTILDPLPDIMQLASLIAVADGVVANDSGPMHLAAALGTPTVGLFGPTSPELGFAPRGDSALPVHLGINCSPCSKHGQRVCWRRERYCLLDITALQVIDALEQCISGGKGTTAG